MPAAAAGTLLATCAASLREDLDAEQAAPGSMYITNFAIGPALVLGRIGRHRPTR